MARPDDFRNESSINDAVATIGLRSWVETQIFDEAVFPVSEHGVQSKPVSREETSSRWGSHQVNNTVDIINPFMVVRSKKYVYSTWSTLRASLITEQESEVEREALERIRDKPFDPQDQSVQEAIDRIEELIGVDLPDIRTHTDAGSLETAIARATNVLIIRRSIRRVRVTSSWHGAAPSGLTDMALIFIGQNVVLSANPPVMIIPMIGHAVYEEAWETQRMVSLVKKPFGCLKGKSSFSQRAPNPPLSTPFIDRPIP